MAYLVQILLPLRDNEGKPFPREEYDDVSHMLIAKFGGLTAYDRAPAQGFWRDEQKTVADTVVVVEVMIGDIDRTWWMMFRAQAEARFRQREIVVRALRIETI